MAISVGVSVPGSCIAVMVVVVRLWWRRRWRRRRRLAGQRQEIALQRLPLNLSLDTTTSSLPADQDSTVDTSNQLDTSTEEEPDQQDPACLEVIAEEPIDSPPIASRTRSHTK